MAIRHEPAKRAICEKLGIDPDRVWGITISMTPEGAVTARIEYYPGEELLDWIDEDMPEDTEIVAVVVSA